MNPAVAASHEEIAASTLEHAVMPAPPAEVAPAVVATTVGVVTGAAVLTGFGVVVAAVVDPPPPTGPSFVQNPSRLAIEA
jgi:hypothetical protein